VEDIDIHENRDKHIRRVVYLYLSFIDRDCNLLLHLL